MVVQVGYSVPYQLHCDTAAHWDAWLLEEMDTTLDELERGVLLGAELDEVVGTELLLVTLEQTLPVMVGISAVLPFLLPCTPKVTDCPG